MSFEKVIGHGSDRQRLSPAIARMLALFVPDDMPPGT